MESLNEPLSPRAIGDDEDGADHPADEADHLEGGALLIPDSEGSGSSSHVDRATTAQHYVPTSACATSSTCASASIVVACTCVAFLVFSVSPYSGHDHFVQIMQSQNPTSIATSTSNSIVEGVYNERSNPPGTCILNPSDMPDRWRIPKKLQKFPDSSELWTVAEQQLADDAVQIGLDELVDFYDTISEERIMNKSTLFANAANSLMDECFSSVNKPAFHDKACKSAARVMKIIAKYFVADEDNKHNRRCRDMHLKTKLLVYANHLSKTIPGDAELRGIRNSLVTIFRNSYSRCDGLSGYLKVSDWKADLKNMALPRDTLKMYTHRANFLIDLYTVPELQVPEELDLYVGRLWKFVADYNYTNGRDVEGGYDNDEARHMGYLVTHIAYMPTGYDRHRQFVKDAPWLYNYIRENFYTALESDTLDLFAEFVDILRQYGCTEDTDAMVRHGSRYFLSIFKESNSTWMDRATDPDASDYDIIHLPWTAIAALRRREVEPIVPGSYGYGFNKALERAATIDPMNASKTKSNHDRELI